MGSSGVGRANDGATIRTAVRILGYDRAIASLPDACRDLTELLGVDTADQLFRAFRGKRINVPRGRSAPHALTTRRLIEAIGDGASALLLRVCEGECIYIPHLCALATALQYAEVRREFDILTVGMSARRVVINLAVKHRRSVRHIWRILKKT